MLSRTVVVVVLIAAACIPPLPAAALSLQSGAQMLRLPQRDRSGSADLAEPPATVTIETAGGQMLFRVRTPETGGAAVASPSLRLAVMLWNRGAPAVAPPSVLFVKSAPGEDASLAGRIFLDASLGGPRLVRSGGTWQKLGASASAAWDSQGTLVSLSVPLSSLAGLCPDGVLLDVRVQRNGVLYSHGAAASWFEPPDPARAVALDRVISGSSASPVQALAASLSPLPVSPGPQLSVYARKPLPLDQEYCVGCEEVSLARELARTGNTTAAIERLQQLVAASVPAELVWQEAMLELQSAWLESGRLEDSIDAGLRLLEAGGTWDATAIPALRTLATALHKAGIKLAQDGGGGKAFLDRFLKAVADANFRAAYGADLLILQHMLPEAYALLETVVGNDSAPVAVKAHALLRLESQMEGR